MSSSSIAELLEERKRNLGRADEDERLEELNAEAQKTQDSLEKLRRMIVNADTIDEAGKSIGDMIESVRKDHEALINSAAKAVQSIGQDKELAITAVEQLQRDKAQAMQDLEQSRKTIEQQANDHVQEAVQVMGDKAREANDREALKALNTFNKKLEQFDRMQSNILTLNETMTAILGVLQSPKVIEFDGDGMPIGVRPQ